MSFTVLIIGGLAVWRLAHMLVVEDGPKDIIAKLRARLAEKQKSSGGLYDAFSCVACMSFWIGSVAALGPAGSVLQWIGYTLAFSAVATLIEAYVTLDA